MIILNRRNTTAVAVLLCLLFPSIEEQVQAQQGSGSNNAPTNSSANGNKPGVSPKAPAPISKQAKARDEKVAVKTNTKQVEIVGEVIDAWCYCSGVMGPGRGEVHKKCARLCVAGGVSAGILTDDGTVYLAGKSEAYKGCAGLLLPYVATRVKVKGWLAERGGLKILKINSVEPADSKKKS